MQYVILYKLHSFILYKMQISVIVTNISIDNLFDSW